MTACRRHRAVVEEVLVHVVGETHLVLGVGRELLVQPLRIEILDLLPGGIGAGAVLGEAEHRVLAIVPEELEAVGVV